MGNDTNYTAPVVPIEYPLDEEPIKACSYCLPWSVEVIPDHPNGGIWIREWHAIGCEVILNWTKESE